MRKLFLLLFISTCLSQSGFTQSDTVVEQPKLLDYDGNKYKTITIGNNVWMAENLRTLHYNNGSKIRGVFAYDENEANVSSFGRLYTWKAAMNGDTREMAQGVCPSGWHLPSDKEWDELIKELGGKENIGKALREADTTFWSGEIIDSLTNKSKLSFRAAGYFDGEYEYFYDLKKVAYFWTSSNSADKFAWAFSIIAISNEIERNAYLKIYGYSIRCVKDK